jgi:RHS repeat-associated protein
MPNVEYIRGHDYGGGVGGLEYSMRSGVAAFNFYDSRGDVTTQTNATGAVTYQTAYEAFGNQTATSGTTSDRQKANTKELDPTGLLNEGFRYRDPSTGTFLTRDPLGFKAGPNMYTYVRQNPWTHFDPEGLDTPPPPPPPPPAHHSVNESSKHPNPPPVKPPTHSPQATTHSESHSSTSQPSPAATPPSQSGPAKSTNNTPPPASSTPNSSPPVTSAKTPVTNDKSGTSSAPSTATSSSNSPATSPTGSNSTHDPNKPDYTSVNINIAIPNPYTLTLVGVSITLNIDRYGDSFLGVGPGVGKSATMVSASMTNNFLTKPGATRTQMTSFLSASGFSAGAGLGFGVQTSYTPGSGSSHGAGVFTPQIGASYNYSVQLPTHTKEW